MGKYVVRFDPVSPYIYGVAKRMLDKNIKHLPALRPQEVTRIPGTGSPDTVRQKISLGFFKVRNKVVEIYIDKEHTEEGGGGD